MKKRVGFGRICTMTCGKNMVVVGGRACFLLNTPGIGSFFVEGFLGTGTV